MDGFLEIDPCAFRDVLATLPTGVTVIAAHSSEGPVGMAANSFTSVSLAPPMVLFCPSRMSATWPKLREAGRFCVNVLAGHHETLSRQFAAKDGNRWAGVAYEDRESGPALSDAVAWIECVMADEHDAGDHTIVVSRVIAIEAATDAALDPLVFFRGRYGSFLAPR